MYEILPFVTLTGKGWSGLAEGIKDVVMNGLGSHGFEAYGYLAIGVGLIGALISVFVHRVSQQSRFPGWFGFVVLALFGSLALSGIQFFIDLLTIVTDWFKTLF